MENLTAHTSNFESWIGFAELLNCEICNPGVGGSNPFIITNKIKGL